MKKWLKVIGGTVIAGGGIWLIAFFVPHVLVFLKGIAGIAVVPAGLIVLAIGISELKD